jgi:predicted 3-demethylubiquinone-9 3-methyltransferase (glyoxalase superfamily)
MQRQVRVVSSCIGLNGGPASKHDEAFSFPIATDDQEETDRCWNTSDGEWAKLTHRNAGEGK